MVTACIHVEHFKFVTSDFFELFGNSSLCWLLCLRSALCHDRLVVKVSCILGRVSVRRQLRLLLVD